MVIMATVPLHGEALPLAPSVFQRRWGWLLTFGIVQVLCGFFALLVPVAATIAAAIVFGALLLVSGAFQAVHAFTIRRWQGVVLHALGALLYIVAALLFLVFPVSGALTLTVIVGALLIADGVIRSALAFRIRPRDGWGWMLASAIASLIVGGLLLLGWPITGFWALGVLLGVNLLFSGFTHCALALTFRSEEKAAP
jgi:uncharacterized membrane protein HdeD (DUF308 family)